MKNPKNVKNVTASSVPSKMRKVMICSPSYDGRVGVYHASALSETCKLGLAQNINIIAVYMSFDALVQRARNDLFQLAVESKVDDMIFIDTDIDWNPHDIFKLLRHDVGIVAAPIVKKSDIENYAVKITGDIIINENGLIPVDGAGTGVMRIRADMIEKIWNVSEEYMEDHKKVPCRMIFEVRIHDGKLQSEDITFCQKIRDMGETIYIDPTITCGHSGEKRWVGNFYNWINFHRNRG